jgi:hypothetical protein
MLPTAFVHQVSFGFEVSRFSHWQLKRPALVILAHGQIAPGSATQRESFRVRLKDFASQSIGATEGCTQESPPAFGWTASAAIFNCKVHMIADESQ